MTIEYSIVIPIYNEADNIRPLVEELEQAMQPYPDSWEVLFVDDGSSDTGPLILEELASTNAHVRALRLKKNFGQSSALMAGVRAANGNWVITLDGDGQNDPADIPLLIDTCKKSPCDLVAGIRQKRKDPVYKRLIGKVANRVRRKILQDATQDTGCSLKMYRRSCLLQIATFNGMHRFLPALFQIEGFTTCQVPVHHRERKAGKSKYNLFNRGFALVYDLLAVAWMRKRRLAYEVEQEL